MRTIRIGDVSISYPDDLVVRSVRVTTEYRQVVVEFGDSKPTEGE